MSGSYWVKPAPSCYAPRRVVVAVVRGKPVGAETRTGRTPQGWDCGAAVASNWGAAGWTRAAERAFDTPDSLHDWIEGRAVGNSSTWVVCPVASHALTLSRFWDRLDTFGAEWSGPRGQRPKPRRPGAVDGAYPADRLCPVFHGPSHRQGVPPKYIFSRLVLRGKPDIVKYTVAGKSLTWVSGCQYLPVTEESLAESLGFLWPDSGGPVPAGSVVLRDPMDRARLWMLAFQRLCDWWRDIDGGPWGLTVGGLALSYFRHRLKPKTVLAHQEPAARELEELAVFGGRASTWYYGTVGDPATAGPDGTAGPPPSPYGTARGPLMQLDVSSMYPTILRERDFPVKLLHHWQDPSVPALREMLDTWAVIALVRLRTEEPEYPVRAGDRVTFPVGEFNTCLCGPELKHALDSGVVLRCFRATTYQRGRPWAGAAGELIGHRLSAARAGNNVWGTFVKLLANNFGGKMAQRKNGWTVRTDVIPERDWGPWREVLPDGSMGGRYTALAGLVWEQVAAPHNGRPLASMFAYLTAYGRDLIRRVRAALPPRTVVSQDTDGIWVLPAATPRLQLAVTLAQSLGFQLRSEEPASAGRWYGPRHYWTPAGWVLAGVHEPHRWVDGRSFDDSYSVNPILAPSKSPPSVVYDCRRTVELRELEVDGSVGPDGWAVPRRHGPVPPLDPATPPRSPLDPP